MDLQALKESINQLITTINEKFEIKNVKSPWKKDKGANIDSPVYTINKEDKPLGVVYGCFSPFTGKYGHARLLEKGKQEGIEDFIIVSPNKTQPLDNDRNMFTLDQKVKIAEEGCKDLGYNILGSFTSKHHFFLDALYEFAEKYPDRRLVLICGPDRAETYMKHCIPFGEEYELADENDIGKFELLTVADRGEKAVSGTKVREAIRNGDKKSFLDMTGYSPKMWTLVNKFVKKNGVLGESVEGSAELLTEDTHSLHIEDSLLKGKDYIKRMLDFFNQVADTLTGSIDKSKPEITVKIDGAPAITMYSKFPGLKGPGVSTKSIFNATPKVYTTDKEIDDDSRSPELKVKLKAALKLAKAKIIPAGEIWQGDLLFTKGDIKKYTDDNGEKYIYFKPNTLVYALPVGSDGAKKALASDIGIVFHTRYTGDSIDSVKQSNDASTDKLNKIPEWAFVMDARLPNLSGVQTLTDEEAAEIEDSLEYLNNLCSEIVRDGDYETLIKNEDFVNFYIMTLQNAKVDKSEQIDPEAFVEELHNWTTLKMSKEYKGLEKLKTKAGRDKRRAAISNKSDDIHDIIEDNEVLLHKIAEALNIATKIKNTFIAKLNSVNRWVNKVETTFGMKDTNGEGFMVSDAEGNFVKLVDRSAFSYFNRSPDVIKGFDARRGQNESFSSWLNSKGIDTKFSLNEAVDSNKIANTTVGAGKNPEYFRILDKAIGINGKIPNEHEAQELLKNGVELIPAYWNESKGQISIPKVFVDAVIKQLLKKKLDCESANGSLRVIFNDGKYIDLHITGKKIELATGKGDVSASKQFLVPETPAQESITASILQAKADKVKMGGTIPECVVKFLGEKKVKGLNDFAKWILSSDPTKNTGLCKYIDFQVPDGMVEEFQTELANFMFGGNQPWFKSFNKLYESSILQEISSVFKNGVSNWTAAKFCHFWNRIGGKTFRGSWIDSYLNEGRCGEPSKDTVDKSDIFLCFNLGEAQRVVTDLMRTETREEYFTKMNTYINEKSFIGISLKKISGEVNLSAVNFKTATTAVGDNINDAKKICFKFIKPGDKGNTLNLQAAKIRPAADPNAVTYEIRVPFNVKHAHDVHMSDGTELIVAIRSNGSRFGAITVEGKFTGASAQLGKMVDPIKNRFNYSPSNALKSRIKPTDSKEKVARGYKSVADELLRLFTSDEETFYKILADGVGYPLQIGKNKNNVIINSAPYIKIY